MNAMNQLQWQREIVAPSTIQECNESDVGMKQSLSSYSSKSNSPTSDAVQFELEATRSSPPEPQPPSHSVPRPRTPPAPLPLVFADELPEFNASDEKLVKSSGGGSSSEDEKERNRIAAREAKIARKQRRLQRKLDRENDRAKSIAAIADTRRRQRGGGDDDDDDEMKFIELVSSFKEKIEQKIVATEIKVSENLRDNPQPPADGVATYGSASSHSHELASRLQPVPLTINIEHKAAIGRQKGGHRRSEVILPMKDNRSEWRKAQLTSTSSTSAMPSIEQPTESSV